MFSKNKDFSLIDFFYSFTSNLMNNFCRINLIYFLYNKLIFFYKYKRTSSVSFKNQFNDRFQESLPKISTLNADRIKIQYIRRKLQ